MRRITIHYIAEYALGVMLLFFGLTVLVTVLLKAWPSVSPSPNVLSALEAYLWSEELVFGFVKLKVMYLFLMGAVAMAAGLLYLAFSRKTLYARESVLLRCSFCSNQWKAAQARGWGTCPHCNKLVQLIVTQSRK